MALVSISNQAFDHNSRVTNDYFQYLILSIFTYNENDYIRTHILRGNRQPLVLGDQTVRLPRSHPDRIEVPPGVAPKDLVVVHNQLERPRLYELEVTNGINIRRLFLYQELNDFIELFRLKVGDTVELRHFSSGDAEVIMDIGTFWEFDDIADNLDIDSLPHFTNGSIRDTWHLPMYCDGTFYFDYLANSIMAKAPLCSNWSERIQVATRLPEDLARNAITTLSKVIIEPQLKPLVLRILAVKSKCRFESIPNTCRGPIVTRCYKYRLTLLCLDYAGKVCQVHFTKESNVGALEVFKVERFLYLERYSKEERSSDYLIPVPLNCRLEIFDIVVTKPRRDGRIRKEYVFEQPIENKYDFRFFKSFNFVKFVNVPLVKSERCFDLVGMVVGVSKYEFRMDEDIKHNETGDLKMQYLLELIDSSKCLVRVLMTIQNTQTYKVCNLLMPGHVIVITNVVTYGRYLLESTDYTLVYMPKCGNTVELNYLGEQTTAYECPTYFEFLASDVVHDCHRDTVRREWVGGPIQFYFQLFSTLDEFLDDKFDTSRSQQGEERQQIQNNRTCYATGINRSHCRAFGDRCRIKDYSFLNHMRMLEWKDFAFTGHILRIQRFVNEKLVEVKPTVSENLLSLPRFHPNKVYGSDVFSNYLPTLPKHFDEELRTRFYRDRLAPPKNWSEAKFYQMMKNRADADSVRRLPEYLYYPSYDNNEGITSICTLVDSEHRSLVNAFCTTKKLTDQLLRLASTPGDADKELFFILDFNCYEFHRAHCFIRMVFKKNEDGVYESVLQKW